VSFRIGTKADFSSGSPVSLNHSKWKELGFSKDLLWAENTPQMLWFIPIAQTQGP